jgi:hypothetical protein
LVGCSIGPAETPNVTVNDRFLGVQLNVYSGAMLGIRNPVTHEFNWVDDAEGALELIVFAQHLLKRAKAAKLNTEQA